MFSREGDKHASRARWRAATLLPVFNGAARDAEQGRKLVLRELEAATRGGDFFRVRGRLRMLPRDGVVLGEDGLAARVEGDFRDTGGRETSGFERFFFADHGFELSCIHVILSPF